MVRENIEQNYTCCNFPLLASNIYWYQSMFNVNRKVPIAMMHEWWFPLTLNIGPYFLKVLTMKYGPVLYNFTYENCVSPCLIAPFSLPHQQGALRFN